MQTNYVKIFRSKNPEIPDEFYGKWIELIRENSDKMPNASNFNLPTTKEECEQMIAIMSSCGIDRVTGMSMLKERKARFDSAVDEYKLKKDKNN